MVVWKTQICIKLKKKNSPDFRVYSSFFLEGRGMMKVDYNLTLIYYIKLLKSQKLIKTWKEGAKIYFDIEQNEISYESSK